MSCLSLSLDEVHELALFNLEIKSGRNNHAKFTYSGINTKREMQKQSSKVDLKGGKNAKSEPLERFISIKLQIQPILELKTKTSQ